MEEQVCLIFYFLVMLKMTRFAPRIVKSFSVQVVCWLENIIISFYINSW